MYVVDPTVTREDLQVIYALPDALHVNTHALTHEDGEILFYPTYQNGEIRRTKRSTSPIHGTELIADRVQSYSVGSILRLNDMEKIDLLKLDIGGAEYDVIDDMLRSSIQPKQLLVEFHHRYSPFRVSDTERALRSLKRAGYQLFSVSDSMREYSFLLSERGNN